jgi:adsorption protein B
MNWQSFDLAVRTATYPVAGAIALNQLDELFIDAQYLLRGLYRRHRRAVSWETLARVEQKDIAILVPAWQEADVIGHMLEHSVSRIDYDRRRYSIFCGTYQNDPATQAEVDRLARRFPNVRKVVVPHAGPTSKADCLNWVYQGILLDEEERGRRYQILLMHDAEDVVHPMSLRLYSHLIPPHDFVQTPVFSLDLRLGQLVAATYVDEFAEHHLKDMLVREAIGGLVPSAGVGSAFARDAFEEIARAHGQRPFHVESLTEDYEIGLKFRLAGKRVHFACRSLPPAPGPLRGELARTAARTGAADIIATREYFPGGLRASIRQRSRWILGITLQTWAFVGWRGTLPVLYCLWRDRKALLTNVLLLLAYLLVFVDVGRSALALADWAPAPVGLGAVGTPLGTLLVANLLALSWRVAVKMSFVGRLYGLGQSLLCLPRMAIANVISVVATGRAVYQFVKHKITGQPLRWLKTAHVFPNAEALRRPVRRRLGEILVEHYGLPIGQLSEALARQRSVLRPLGEVLLGMGVVSGQDVLRALAEQRRIPPEGAER